MEFSYAFTSSQVHWLLSEKETATRPHWTLYVCQRERKRERERESTWSKEQLILIMEVKEVYSVTRCQITTSHSNSPPVVCWTWRYFQIFRLASSPHTFLPSSPPPSWTGRSCSIITNCTLAAVAHFNCPSRDWAAVGVSFSPDATFWQGKWSSEYNFYQPLSLSLSLSLSLFGHSRFSYFHPHSHSIMWLNLMMCYVCVTCLSRIPGVCWHFSSRTQLSLSLTHNSQNEFLSFLAHISCNQNEGGDHENEKERERGSK